MNLKKLKAWLPAFMILEVGTTLMSLGALGKRRPTTPGEGNKIARLFLDNPSDFESFVFYFIAAHVLIGLFLFAGWVATIRKNAREKKAGSS